MKYTDRNHPEPRDNKMITYSYKHGFIHDNFTTGVIQIQVQGEHGFLMTVKSVHAAKILLTKHFNKWGA